MDDKAVRIFNPNPGDRLSATIMTAGAPEILMAQQIDAEPAAATATSPAGTDVTAAARIPVLNPGGGSFQRLTPVPDD